MGHAFEFSDSLSDLQADYNEVVVDSLREKMDILGDENSHAGAAAAGKCFAATFDEIEPGCACATTSSPKPPRAG